MYDKIISTSVLAFSIALLALTGTSHSTQAHLSVVLRVHHPVQVNSVHHPKDLDRLENTQLCIRNHGNRAFLIRASSPSNPDMVLPANDVRLNRMCNVGTLHAVPDITMRGPESHDVYLTIEPE